MKAAPPVRPAGGRPFFACLEGARSVPLDRHGHGVLSYTNMCSPVTSSMRRLVAGTRSSGQAVNNALANSAQADVNTGHTEVRGVSPSTVHELVSTLIAPYLALSYGGNKRPITPREAARTP